jgi:hypothetical protein
MASTIEPVPALAEIEVAGSVGDLFVTVCEISWRNHSIGGLARSASGHGIVAITRVAEHHPQRLQ